MLMNSRSIYLLIIPLILSAFTHLWNPLGFPSFWYVEEIYLQRAMHVLHGLGNVDPLTTYGHPYDHPYFSQLILAGLLKIINYPALLNLFVSMPSSYTLGDSSADLSYSIDLLHLIPRLLIGTLAILDTFLIYKIAEHSYNSRTVAFIASLLFAVMPITWLTRKILLENLLLPLLLSSILFSIYYRKSSESTTTHQINTRAKQLVLISISGIFWDWLFLQSLPHLP
jgi:dolichyl-phosphate-mannose--protein O-mannosyl transferase